MGREIGRSKDWMDEAEGNLEHAKSDLKGKYYNWACCSAQQAAEKAVKVVFQKMGAEAWGHSVADLLVELSKKDIISEDGSGLVDFFSFAYRGGP